MAAAENWAASMALAVKVGDVAAGELVALEVAVRVLAVRQVAAG